MRRKASHRPSSAFSAPFCSLPPTSQHSTERKRKESKQEKKSSTAKDDLVVSPSSRSSLVSGDATWKTWSKRKQKTKLYMQMTLTKGRCVSSAGHAIPACSSCCQNPTRFGSWRRDLSADSGRRNLFLPFLTCPYSSCPGLVRAPWRGGCALVTSTSRALRLLSIQFSLIFTFKRGMKKKKKKKSHSYVMHAGISPSGCWGSVL